VKATAKRAAVSGAVKMPPFEVHTTRDGLVVHAAQRGALPLVAVRLILRCGSTDDPAGKEGLADFTVRLMRRGTERLSADAINEEVEFVGASLGMGSSEDATSFGTTTPSEHFEAMLSVLGQIVREPSFPQAELETARSRTLAQHANDLDDPGTVADRAFLRALWGDHPYGHEIGGGEKSVQSFTRDDVVRFHREHLGPRIATLIVVGDVEPKRVFRAAERAFAGWKGGPELTQLPPAAPKAAGAGQVILVDKPEQTQAQVRIGGMGFAKGALDLFPARVMNMALGEGFTSRLVNEIRVNRGLSYGVGSHFDTLRAGGTFSISTFTKTSSTQEILEVALAETEKVRKRGITPAELLRAKTYLAGLFPLRLETNEALAGARAEIVLYELGEDWVDRYRERVHEVTLAQARQVAGKYLFAQKPAIVVVGKAAQLRKQVARFGEVKVWSLSEVV
jgi:zinc protease